jgi:dihydroorotase
METVILKNGTVYDPLTKDFEKKDIAVSGKKIIAADEIPSGKASIIDVTDCLVTPGLIDYHIHLYSGCDGAVKADIMTFPNGVTTAVDGGTCGVSNFEMFVKTDITQSLTRIKSYLNVSPAGLASSVFSENVNPEYYDLEKMRDLFHTYSEHLVALKLRISRNIVGSSGLTREPLIQTIKIAEELECPVVVHMNDPIIDVEEAVEYLRPCDVFCHMYYGDGSTIVNHQGMVKEKILEARKRGVLFDACNGKGNFQFKTAIPAIQNGFYPDIISTDFSPMTQYVHPVISLPHLMSKYMNMGMPLAEVLNAVILEPARQLKMEEELATLKAGTTADIAVFKIVEKDTRFYDFTEASIEGHQLIVPQMTIKDGAIVYRQTDLD